MSNHMEKTKAEFEERWEKRILCDEYALVQISKMKVLALRDEEYRNQARSMIGDMEYTRVYSIVGEFRNRFAAMEHIRQLIKEETGK
jgi:hypothetical protein